MRYITSINHFLTKEGAMSFARNSLLKLIKELMFQDKRVNGVRKQPG